MSKLKGSKLMQVSKTIKTDQTKQVTKVVKAGEKLKSLLDEIESGDCLPEAEIVCNIVDKLHTQLRLTACLVCFCTATNDEVTDHFLAHPQNGSSVNMQKSLEQLVTLYKSLKEEETRDDNKDKYDADVEQDHDQIITKKKKKKTGVLKKVGIVLRLKGDSSGQKTTQLHFLVRDAVFYIMHQFGSNIKQVLDKEPNVEMGLASLAKLYEKFKCHAYSTTATPRNTSVKETRILVDKINSREKQKKTKIHLSSEVDLLRSSHRNILKEKQKEREKLEAEIEGSKKESEANIVNIRRQVQNKVKEMEWVSGQKQVEMRDRILGLVAEHQELCDRHWAAEREARHRNINLEAQVNEILINYDKEMFSLYDTFEKLEKKYAKEKEDLRQIEKALEVEEAEKEIIMEEMRAEEAKIRNAKLEEIKRRRAAITLQRAWRQHKVLQAQSKKKKKGRKKTQ